MLSNIGPSVGRWIYRLF